MSRAGNLFQENFKSGMQDEKSKRSLFYEKGPVFKLGMWLLKNGLSVDAWTFLMFVLICISTFFLISIFLKSGIFIFILLSVIFIFLTFILIDFRGRKIINKKEEQLEGFLIDLVGNLYANPNILAAIQKTLETSEDPLRREFESVVDDVRRGLLLNEALKNMLGKNMSKIFHIVITGLTAANEKGADLINFLKDQIDYIREKKSISNYIKILSSGPRYTSYIIMLIPLAALAISALINRNFVGSLLSGAGIAVLIYSIISYTAGFIIINRIVSFIEH
ncbi:MAG: hypothetical protein FJW69_02950 [Actinobacteria bacterium]|nr:hypothetical protein [Actinomycetota bacterium]